MATVNPQWNAIASLVSVKLDENNYLLWKSQLRSAMYSQDLLRYVDGSSTSPPERLNANSAEINPEYIKWKRSDQLTLSWILSTVSESILTQIISYDTAREAWVALANAHASHSNIRILQLKRDLQNAKKNDKSMLEYLNHVKFLVDSLRAVNETVSDSDLSVDFNYLLLKSLLKSSLQQQPFSLNEEAMVVVETGIGVVGLIVAETVVVVVAVEGTLTLLDEALQGKGLLKMKISNIIPVQIPTPVKLNFNSINSQAYLLQPLELLHSKYGWSKAGHRAGPPPGTRSVVVYQIALAVVPTVVAVLKTALAALPNVVAVQQIVPQENSVNKSLLRRSMLSMRNQQETLPDDMEPFSGKVLVKRLSPDQIKDQRKKSL
ncbi:hypothetical protein EJ110_NYTH54655 [Nymphaea thermarum]|nr:hypothetical protein EJ110_NYTH54655 [Nymphaea thermarum]